MHRRIDLEQRAKQVRNEFEQRQIPKDVLVRLYAAYNPAVAGSRFVDEAEKIFPRLNCGLTSVYLQSILGGEIIQGAFHNNNHTYLIVEDLVVDITADQYGGPRVYVGELVFPWQRNSYAGS